VTRPEPRCTWLQQCASSHACQNSCFTSATTNAGSAQAFSASPVHSLSAAVPLESFEKNFCACDRICTAVLVPMCSAACQTQQGSDQSVRRQLLQMRVRVCGVAEVWTDLQSCATAARAGASPPQTCCAPHLTTSPEPSAACMACAALAAAAGLRSQAAAAVSAGLAHSRVQAAYTACCAGSAGQQQAHKGRGGTAGQGQGEARAARQRRCAINHTEGGDCTSRSLPLGVADVYGMVHLVA
jgi:hypothetical protein